MRHVVMLLLAAALAGCGATPKPFEHDAADTPRYQPKQDAAEVAIETPANMPEKMAERLAAALAIELQAYGIVAALAPSQAPLKITGAMTTRDATLGSGIEVEINWYLLSGGKVQGPVVSRTTAQPSDYADASDWLVSRMAQQAAPRVATLMGKSPGIEARSIGAAAAGVSMPDASADPMGPQAPAAVPGSTEAAAKPSAAPAAPAAPQVKVAVAPVTGAPSDGNQQLFSGMRRALGSNKIVLVDKGGGDAFTVTAAVSLKPIDERTVLLTINWTLKDPSGKDIGNIEQTNPVPAAATRGSWVGFGDIVASAAVEGVLELLEKALNKPH
jgi:uncharacterized lipoprotein YmbA